MLLERDFGLSVSVWTAGRYLRSWGMTPQKPVRRAYERDSVAVAAWLNDIYPAIARRAKAEGAEVHWGDELEEAGACAGRLPSFPERDNDFAAT